MIEIREQHHSMLKSIIPIAVTAGMLMGGSEIYTEPAFGAQSSGHHIQLSDQEFQGLIKPKLPFKIIVPGISAGEDNIKAGVNTHVGYDNKPAGFVDKEGFKKQVDLVRSEGLTEIRVGIPRWEVASLSEDKTKIVWNEQQLTYFREAISYAEQNGLKIYFPSVPPEVPSDFDFEKYLEISRQYYERIGKEFPNVIHQPGNEYDVHNIFNYGAFLDEQGSVRQLNDHELEMYRRWLDVSVRALKKDNPLAQVTQSLSGYPMGSHKVGEWVRIDKIIGKYIDFYSLDTYPTSVDQAKHVAEYILSFQNAVRKDVVVTEIGIPTSVFSEKDQAEIIRAAIEVLKRVGLEVLVYQLRDEVNKVLPHPKSRGQLAEESFGLLDEKGEKKTSYKPVMDALRDPVK